MNIPPAVPAFEAEGALLVDAIDLVHRWRDGWLRDRAEVVAMRTDEMLVTVTPRNGQTLPDALDDTRWNYFGHEWTDEAETFYAEAWAQLAPLCRALDAANLYDTMHTVIVQAVETVGRDLFAKLAAAMGEELSRRG